MLNLQTNIKRSNYKDECACGVITDQKHLAELKKGKINKINIETNGNIIENSNLMDL